jgi:hypothetical protein
MSERDRQGKIGGGLLIVGFVVALIVASILVAVFTKSPDTSGY